MRFENRLQPFEMDTGLHLSILPALAVDFADDESTYAHFGFSERSKQSRFFTDLTSANRVVAIPHEGDVPPTSMVDARVVARLFGTVGRDGSLELWHLSVNASHALNDTAAGTRWGVHNLESCAALGDRVTFWRTLTDGKRVTSRNARAHVRGTPNPYAVECLVRCVERLGCPSVRQHDGMPCAQLFHGGYDERTHPATMLLYEALKFERAPGLSHYTWHADFMVPLTHSFETMRDRMRCGLSVV